MFTNLIESSSHAKEFKRRGSFLLFTTATYVVLFVITGVVSIYAYDAHLEEQSDQLEILAFVPPPAADEPPVVKNTIPPSSTTANNSGQSTRTALVDSTSNPNNPPKEISALAQSIPGARPDSIIGQVNSDPPGPTGTRNNTSTGGTGVIVSIPDEPPPPTPAPTPVAPKVVKVSEILNSRAIALPKPPYPQMAIQIRVQGTVTVQVLIDEAGRVLSAKAMSGHPLLVPDSQRAALQARFSPTTINGQPVKVSGVITYNFVLP
jgi:protein TonB